MLLAGLSRCKPSKQSFSKERFQILAYVWWELNLLPFWKLLPALTLTFNYNFSHFTWKIEAVLEKIGSHQTLEEDVKEANAKCDAATDAVTRALCAAKRAAVKSKRILEAITKAREKRPMTGKTSFSCYTGACFSCFLLPLKTIDNKCFLDIGLQFIMWIYSV